MPKYKTIMMQQASISGCSKATVKNDFLHHSINIIPDPLNIDKELMEIRFNDVIVSYIINNQDVCCTGYLFVDDTTNLRQYLNVCNKYFMTIAQDSWKYQNCYIELQKEGRDFYFVFYPNP